ncbi:hypothetical protein GGR92_004686 [Spirosoma lacussanchae]|uniref:DUF6443 domain-containing protein n=1 Tax=Spirosoma lacussanchae TaxID=1884249 RepID=UPI001108FA7E|nr:DUF6443 domain-containing protein [Spirosoma lacussanchae]
MRIRFHLLTFFGCTLLTLGGGAALLAQVPANARLTRTYKASNTGDNPANATFAAPSEQVTSQLTYFDGLGKPVQQVSPFWAANKADLVSLTQYDNLFRPHYTFLPAPLTTNGGAPLEPGSIKDRLAAYYQDPTRLSAPIPAGDPEQARASVITYEPAPTSRITSQQAPGARLAATQVHGVNAEGEVKYYRCTGPGLTSLSPAGTYGAGELTWVRSTDEGSGSDGSFGDIDHLVSL